MAPPERSDAAVSSADQSGGRWRRAWRVLAPDSRRLEATGRAVPVGYVRWASLDTASASLDSLGLLVGRRLGAVRIVASAGGWRTDTAVVQIRRLTSAPLLEESWNPWPSNAFVSFGTPKPEVVNVPGRGRAMFHNGDKAFTSGVYSRTQWDARDGLGVEFDMRLPVTRTQWQTLNVILVAGISDASLAKWDHVTAAFGGDSVSSPVASCFFGVPGAEGLVSTGRASLEWSPGSTRSIAHPGIGSDHWFLVRLQLFRDGRCGIALDGRPVLRSTTPIPLASPFRLVMSGYSVGTQALVGPVTVWSGVRPGVDWDALDTKRTAPNP